METWRKRPEIILPITDPARDEIIKRAQAFAALDADLVEWRVDHFAGDEREVIDIVHELKKCLSDKKLIVTLRTVAEGGEKNGERFDYEKLLTAVAKDGTADYIDAELRGEPELVQRILEASHRAGVKVIGSYHDFLKTPKEEEILGCLRQAKQMGADVGKFACMPSAEDEQGRKDAETLLTATERMKKEAPDFPLITMSMGEAGKVTRLYGGLYGSGASFGCVGTPSAPGQIELEEMKAVFDKIYVGKKHIALIGFMGAGKSSVSRQLHRMTGWPEIDTDQKIVETEGCSIPQIFSEKGEPYFRQLETELLDELGPLAPGIISCGGGMAMRDINVKKLHALADVVLLTAAPETIYDRVKDSTNRPLLNGNMNVPYIRDLMEKRRPFYEKAANVVVSTDGKSVSEIAKEILSKCR